MKYEIIGGNLPAVVLELDRGEQVFSETGGMAWMTDGVSMETNMEGGLFKGLARAVSGESMFLVTYSAQQNGSKITFTSSFPGSIMPVRLAAGQSIICQKQAFLCAERSVTLNVHMQRRLGSGLFGGEGFILQKLTGPGVVFLEIDGSVVEQELQPGEVLKVDNGHVAMFEPSVDFSLETVSGFKNVLFGGEGLFLAKLRGPGKVWMQTMPVVNLAQRIIPFVPQKK